MTDFEREVIDRLGRIETKLDADYKAIHGNGKPGLIDKIGSLENRISILESSQSPSNSVLDTRLQEVEARHKNGDSMRSSIFSWIAILFNAVGTIFALLQSKWLK